MNSRLLKEALDTLELKDLRELPRKPKGRSELKPYQIKRANDRTLSYTERHRSHWFKPEYNLAQIQIAQDSESFIARALRKKVNRIITAGWDFIGENPETVRYLKTRIRELEIAGGKPFNILISQVAFDMFRFQNAMLAKVRSDGTAVTSGKAYRDARGNWIQPVIAYFILPFETLEFRTKQSGEIIEVKQTMPTGKERKWRRNDIVHFWDNRKPGFSIGTPELYPALDDIKLLRRIEENVEELIESNLFPLFHYKVGNDNLPERITPEGLKETDVVKETIEYMPASGMIVSDHRHEISAIGSESKALRIEMYLEYFKKRVYTALGVSPVDMGEGESANRSTASTLSKGLIQDVEAMQFVMKEFIEYYIIHELLIEGGYNPFDEAQRVFIRFGVVDREERIKQENQAIQLFVSNLLTQTEARALLGHTALRDEQQEDTHYKLYAEPGMFAKSVTPGSATGEALAGIRQSNMTPEAINKEKSFAKEQQKAQATNRAGQRSGESSRSAINSSRSMSRPTNQYGARSGPKTTRDHLIEQALTDGYSLEEIENRLDNLTKKIEQVDNAIERRYNSFGGRITKHTIKDSLSHLIDNLYAELISS